MEPSQNEDICTAQQSVSRLCAGAENFAISTPGKLGIPSGKSSFYNMQMGFGWLPDTPVISLN